MRFFALPPLLLAALPLTESAAQPAELTPGQRVRVVLVAGGRPLIGTLMALPDDTIRLAVYRNDSSLTGLATVLPTLVARDRVRRIDVSRGRSGEAGFQAGIPVTLVSLAVAGLSYAAMESSGNEGGVYLGALVTVGALAGAVGGVYTSIVGAAVGKERWQTKAVSDSLGRETRRRDIASAQRYDALRVRARIPIDSSRTFPQLALGSHVRAFITGDTVPGTLVRQTSDSIAILGFDGITWAFARIDVAALDASTGDWSLAGRGTAIGAGVGLISPGLILTAAFGGLIGHGVGKTSYEERWIRVYSAVP